jgi:CubicO group peptidase (beta-lactamase class C family)
MKKEMFLSVTGLTLVFMVLGSDLSNHPIPTMANVYHSREKKGNEEVEKKPEFQFKKISREDNESEKGLSASTVSRLDNYAEFLYRKRGFNGSIAIGRKGYMVYKKHIGYTNLRYRTKPINDESNFQLASLSKQFIAASVMLLHQQGRLDYEEPAAEYIGGFPYQKVTIRHLLNHTSGVPNYMWLAERKWKGKFPPDNGQMIKMMSRHNLIPHFEPGTRYKYSNTGYMILAGIVEEISEQPIGPFLEKNFFSRIGMNNTYTRSFSGNTIHHYRKDPQYPDELVGYRWSYRRHVSIPPTVNDGVIGDKGIYSTSEDLLKWDQSLEKNFILADSTLQEAYNRGTTNNGYTIPYGFGYHLPNGKKELKAYHNGVWNGFTNTYRKYHEDSLTIILLSNSSFRRITPTVNHIRNIINQ